MEVFSKRSYARKTCAKQSTLLTRGHQAGKNKKCFVFVRGLVCCQAVQKSEKGFQMWFSRKPYWRLDVGFNYINGAG